MTTEAPRYHINVFWYPDDQCWIADVPDLRPCSARGETPERATVEVQQAIDHWIETALAASQPIPEPKYSPALYAAG
jgi:predicted RNase H-like HicB family nuclease